MDTSAPSAETLLLGPASLDRYLAEGVVLPGGGVLNMAYHWARAGVPFHLLTRVGDDHPEVFRAFLRRHDIAHSADAIVAPGRSASIDVVVREDRQPWMDNFVEGVWTDFRLTANEETLLASARRLHTVLVGPVVREVERLRVDGRLDHVMVTGDFLSLRRYTLDRFARTLAHLDAGFVGWPGEPDDPMVGAMRDAAFDLRRLVVVTMGARDVRVFDGRGHPTERSVRVRAVPVRGTTVGCGDSFIAAFLAAWWRGADACRAAEQGAEQAALATAWSRPLPDVAYAG